MNLSWFRNTKWQMFKIDRGRPMSCPYWFIFRKKRYKKERGIMSESTVPLEGEAETTSSARDGNLAKLMRYTVTKLILLIFTVAVGIYLTVLIANMGGYVDEIRRGTIRESVSLQVLNDPAMQQLDPEVRNAQMAEMIRLAAYSSLPNT